MTILTKTAKDGRQIEIRKVSYDRECGAIIAAFIGGDKIASGWPVAAAVNGRPEVTHVFAGKIALTSEEMATINAAFADDRKMEDVAIRAEIAAEDSYKAKYNKIANA